MVTYVITVMCHHGHESSLFQHCHFVMSCLCQCLNHLVYHCCCVSRLLCVSSQSMCQHVCHNCHVCHHCHACHHCHVYTNHSTHSLHAYLKLLHLGHESFKQQPRLEVAGDESWGVTLNDGWEDEVLLSISHSLEVTRDRNKLLHLTEVFCLDLLQRWTELESLLSVNWCQAWLHQQSSHMYIS